MKSLYKILGDAVSEGILEGIGARLSARPSDYPTDERATRVILPPGHEGAPISLS